MKTLLEKKTELRELIINASIEYKNYLAGRSFLYIYGNNYFEVVFKIQSFKHLTGVNSCLSANKFYENAKNKTLTVSQFDFTNRFPYDIAKKKLPVLADLKKLTNSEVCVVCDYQTMTVTYKLGITNIHFTLGLIKDSEPPHLFVPQTLRIKDKSIENSCNADFIDFIFEKNASEDLYENIMYREKNKKLPEKFLNMLSDDLKSEFSQELLV